MNMLVLLCKTRDVKIKEQSVFRLLPKLYCKGKECWVGSLRQESEVSPMSRIWQF